MFSIPRVFNKFLRFIGQRDTPMPAGEQAYNIEDLGDYELDEAIDRWVESRRNRFGPHISFKIKLTKVFRLTDYLGERINNIAVRPDQALSFEAVIVGPDGKPIEISGMLPSGRRWTPELEEQFIRKSAQRAAPKLFNTYEDVKYTKKRVYWFINTWEPY